MARVYAMIASTATELQHRSPQAKVPFWATVGLLQRGGEKRQRGGLANRAQTADAMGDPTDHSQAEASDEDAGGKSAEEEEEIAPAGARLNQSVHDCQCHRVWPRLKRNLAASRLRQARVPPQRLRNELVREPQQHPYLAGAEAATAD
jgi:hypothetical protein